MDRQKIESKVKEILIDTLGVEPDMVMNESSIQYDLGADSLDAVDLIIKAEREFGISIKDEEAVKCQKVKDIYDLIEKSL